MGDSFDHYRDSYHDEVQHSIGFMRQEHEFFLRSKAYHLVDIVRRQIGPTESLDVLDVGCGVGAVESIVAERFASVRGVDVAEAVVEKARELNPGIDFSTYDGNTLPFTDDRFDVAFAICVLHHVEPGARQRVIEEMRRVTRPGGLVVIFEHNPTNPLTRLAVARCKFDEDVVLLSRRDLDRLLVDGGLSIVERRYILFLPWLLRVSLLLDGALSWLPLGAQQVTVARAS